LGEEGTLPLDVTCNLVAEELLGVDGPLGVESSPLFPFGGVEEIVGCISVISE